MMMVKLLTMMMTGMMILDEVSFLHPFFSAPVQEEEKVRRKRQQMMMMVVVCLDVVSLHHYCDEKKKTATIVLKDLFVMVTGRQIKKLSSMLELMNEVIIAYFGMASRLV